MEIGANRDQKMALAGGYNHTLNCMQMAPRSWTPDSAEDTQANEDIMISQCPTQGHGRIALMS